MQVVKVQDSCQFKDFIAGNMDLIKEKKSKAPYVGLVRIIQDGNVVSIDKDHPEGWLTNVTVGIGREYVAQRVFGLTSGRTTNLTVAGTIDVSAFTVTHFGIGSGGTSAGPTLVTPTVADTKLNSALQFNASALDYNNGSTTQTKAAKSITSGGGSIVFQTDPLSNNNYSAVKCTCVVAASEPITNELGATLTTGNAAKIDEAMLFASSGTTLIPFAHITFMPKYVEFESTLTIEWIIIF